MTHYQENKDAMYGLTGKGLDERTPAIKLLMAGVDDAVLSFKQNIILLRAKSAVQTTDLTGFTVQKHTYKGIMVDKTIDACNKTRSCALNTDLPVLAAECNQNRYDLMNMPEAVCAAVCLNMHNKILEVVASLVDYGVTAPILADLLTAIDVFNDYKVEPRDNINLRKQATKAIGLIINANEILLERIDASVRMLETSHPEFCASYFESREIIDTGSKKLALRGTVRTVAGAVIANVKFNIDGKKLKKKTSDKGNFQMRNLLPGDYVAMFRKFGFKDLDVPFSVNSTERTELNVVMKAVEVVVPLDNE